jgi:hypothetical protein
MMALLAGPIGRQLIQIGAAAVATTGVVNENEVTTLVGAITSIVNIGWVIYVKITGAK